MCSFTPKESTHRNKPKPKILNKWPPNKLITVETRLQGSMILGCSKIEIVGSISVQTTNVCIFWNCSHLIPAFPGSNKCSVINMKDWEKAETNNLFLGNISWFLIWQYLCRPSERLPLSFNVILPSTSDRFYGQYLQQTRLLLNSSFLTYIRIGFWGFRSGDI
jgi:hypothetical protein